MHKQKKMRNYIKLYFIFFIILSTLLCCKNNRNKENYLRTVSVCNYNLNVEVYCTFGSGAFGSDKVEDYLTDSTNFRIRIAEYDEYYGNYFYQCNMDSITIEKCESNDAGEFHVVETKIYNLEKLKKLQNISNSEVENISDKYLFTTP